MGLSMWPGRSRSSVARFLILAGMLVLAIVGAIELKRLRPDQAILKLGSAVSAVRASGKTTGETPSTESQALQLKLRYTWDIVNQMKVADAALRYWQRHASVPASVEDLVGEGVRTQFQHDPWGRPFIIRALQPDLIVVESTGPSGVDRVPWADQSKLSDLRARGFQAVDGNILVARKVGRPLGSRDSAPPPRKPE
jgi:HAMP domain-containing protein